MDMPDITDAKKSESPLLGRFQLQLFGLILLVFIPAFILTVSTNLKERRIAQQSLREQTRAVARFAVAKQENFVKNAEQILATVSQFSFLTSAEHAPFAEVHFINLKKILPEYADFGLIEADGTLFCSAVLTNSSMNFSNWSCFQRVSRTQRFSVGDFSTNGPTGRETLDFGYPVFNDEGAFTRVCYASLDLTRLKEVIYQIDLPDEAVLTVMDGSGNLIARHPDTGEFQEDFMASSPRFQRALNNRETIFEMPGLDGVKRTFGIATVTDGVNDRLWIAIAIPTATLFASVNAALWRNILILAIVALVALAVAYFYAERFFLRPVRSLIVQARSLTTGEWKVHSENSRGRGELAELSRTFNTMALTLESQRKDIQTANAELEQRVRERTAQVEQANKELESFSYSVSHDLRAPLRHITGFVDLLRKELSDSTTAKTGRFLTVIADAARQMGALIDDLLVFSRMGRVEMQKTVVNTNEVVEKSIASLEPETKGRNILWKKTPLPQLQVDPAMLRQVFVNLIANAIKYSRTRDPAHIQIDYEKKENEVVIFIRDNGVGFDMRYAGKLFGVFQRLHQADEFEGTGIGLANVRRIIQRHGGRTWAEGIVDGGATFYFSLPQNGTFHL